MAVTNGRSRAGSAPISNAITSRITTSIVRGISASPRRSSTGSSAPCAWTPAVDEGHYHRERRASILRSRPDVRRLFGPSPATALFASGVVAAQLALAWAVAGASWWLLPGAAYAAGAFLAHYLNVVIHECSHNLVFRSTPLNKAFGILVNLPGVLPSAIPFRHYHLLHHRFLG